MRSRWGGFRAGRRWYKDQWDTLKSPSSSADISPAKATDFDYTNAQGIWPVRATTQFAKRPTEILFVGSRVATNINNRSYYNYLTGLTGGIDTQARPGDLVLVADGTGIYTDNYLNLNLLAPSGWTNIYSDDEVGANDTYGVKGNMFYKTMADPADTSVLINAATGTTTNSGYYSKASTVIVFRASRGTLSVNTANKISYSTSNSSVIGTRTISSLTPGSTVVAAALGGQSTTLVYHSLPDNMTETSSFGANDTSDVTLVTGFKSNVDSTSFSITVGNSNTSTSFTAAFMAVEIKITE